MKKNLISLAVATTVAGVAAGAVQAQQYVNPEGTGQVLMFPFYDGENGNASNMHVVNTTGKTKAVKVRFVEYKNSDEVLDFNLYLSPYDHFAFGVIQDPNGTGGAVITSDNSCTVPALGSPNGAFSGTQTENADGSITRVQPFVNYQYAKDFDNDIARTIMGHVEIIEMGEVGNVGDPLTQPAAKASQYAAFAKHGATGVPANCGGLSTAWATAALWGNNAQSGISAPKGGLYGLAYHINVDDAAAFTYNAIAVDKWADAAADYHTDPGSDLPTIAGGVKSSVVHHGTNADYYSVEQTWLTGAEATSSLLATTSLSNDVMVNPALGGQTDWVITFPTKKFHVDVALAANVIAPFEDNWVGITGTTTKKEKPACEEVTVTYYDREEKTTVEELGFSPTPAGTSLKICNETAVVAMGAGATSALNVERGLQGLSYPYTEGWARIDFAQEFRAAGNSTNIVKGLPVTGFAAYKISNGTLGDAMYNYGHTSDHKTNNVLSSASTLN